MCSSSAPTFCMHSGAEMQPHGPQDPPAVHNTAARQHGAWQPHLLHEPDGVDLWQLRPPHKHVHLARPEPQRKLRVVKRAGAALTRGGGRRRAGKGTCQQAWQAAGSSACSARALGQVLALLGRGRRLHGMHVRWGLTSQHRHALALQGLKVDGLGGVGVQRAGHALLDEARDVPAG